MNQPYQIAFSECVAILDDRGAPGIEFKLVLNTDDTVDPAELTAQLTESIGQPGEKFNFPDTNNTSNENFIIVKFACRRRDDGKYLLSYICRPECEEVKLLGEIVEKVDEANILRRCAKWRVPTSRIAFFNPLAGTELNWSEEIFVCENSTLTPDGSDAYILEILARKVETRLIESRTVERFAGFDSTGNPIRETVFYAIWRVAATDMMRFQSLAGTINSELGCSNGIITEVIPRQLNSAEFSVEITAEAADNPSLSERYKYKYSNLSSLIEYEISAADFFVSSEMAGYTVNEDNEFVPIENWSPSQSPFSTSSQLGVNYINSTIKCLIIKEVRYQQGSAVNVLSTMSNWFNGKVYSGAVGGVSGSYLKLDAKSKEVRDCSGNTWTQITYIYKKSPSSLAWNYSYWSNK